jgi:quercetin dioxygenase-like cupin family protein
MGFIVNRDSVEAQSLTGGALRQRLVDTNHVPGTACLFDRVTFDAGTGMDLAVEATAVLWGQVLAGSATLLTGDTERPLAELDAFLLPPGFTGTLRSEHGAELVTLTVPDAAGLDPDLSSIGSEAKFVDLSTEPLLQSEHDERKRIYMASKALFGTTALAGEIVIFPPGSAGKNHHHTGTEHFQYIMRGSGTAFLDEAPHRVGAGDLVYKHEGERHFVQNDPDTELAFVEFFVPGVWETEWADPALACTWAPTGTSISGEDPTREIAAHTSDGTVHEDV